MNNINLQKNVYYITYDKISEPQSASPSHSSVTYERSTHFYFMGLSQHELTSSISGKLSYYAHSTTCYYLNGLHTSTKL